MSIALIAALPREIAGLVKGSKPVEALKKRKVYLYRVGNAVIVAAGMGAARATLAVEAALQAGDVRTLFSVGLAGGCDASVRAGTVVEADTVIDSRTGERFFTADRKESCTLVSSDSIASAQEKARLAAGYRAAMVDMEAATVGRLARAHGLPFRAIKGISDAHDFEMEPLARFATPDGQFRTAAFALHTAMHPGEWGRAMELGRNSAAALRGLEEKLLPFIGAA